MVSDISPFSWAFGQALTSTGWSSDLVTRHPRQQVVDARIAIRPSDQDVRHVSPLLCR